MFHVMVHKISTQEIRDFVMSSNYCYNLKGHDRQYSGQMSQNIQN